MASTSIARRRRQTYEPELKARLVSTCLQPGVSIAAIALANQLNANLLRRWVREHEERQDIAAGGTPAVVRAAPALVPVTLQTADAPPAGDIRCEIRHHHTVIHVTWPLSQASACAQWLREILR